MWIIEFVVVVGKMNFYDVDICVMVIEVENGRILLGVIFVFMVDNEVVKMFFIECFIISGDWFENVRLGFD